MSNEYTNHLFRMGYKFCDFKKYTIWVVVILLSVFYSNSYAYQVEFKDRDGLFLFTEETDVLVKSKYVGWMKQDSRWKWDGPRVRKIKSNQDEQQSQLAFRHQKVDGQVSRHSSENRIIYNYHLSFTEKIDDTVGGGIEFKLNLSSSRLKRHLKEPELLPDNKGWIWEISPGKKVEVVFSPGVAKVFFEKGKRSTIRVLFFKDKITPGELEFKMEVVLSQDIIIANESNDINKYISSEWISNALDPENAFIDLSYLNEKPAGLHGFVHADRERLMFEDGTEARFYGINIQANALFIRNKDLAKKHAQRLARLGVNLVRLHHHDSARWVRPSLIADGDTTQEIDEEALNSYFWWVKCLRDEGIYLWIDLQVQRPWRVGDAIPGWDTDMLAHTKRGMNVSPGFIYLNQRMQDLTKKFNEQLLTRVNPYTDLALKDDPAIMSVLVTNENDLTQHFGNRFLENKGFPYHRKLFEQEVEKFSKKYQLSSAELSKTWEPGVSKLLLNELEARFNQKMIEHLRALGVKVPIATTNHWAGNSLFSLPSLTMGDMIDTHAYAKDDLLRKNPRYSPNFIHRIGQGQVIGMPLTVSEYNIEQKFVLDQGHVVPLYVAAMAVYQGWDAIMLFGYSNNNFKNSRISPWSSYKIPSIAGLIPASAIMYRLNHVSPAKETVVISPDTNSFFYNKNSPRQNTVLRTALEQHRLEIAIPGSDVLDWLEPSDIPDGAYVIKDLEKDELRNDQNYIESDTGEIVRNWEKGMLTINTPKSQAAIGEIGKEIITLTDVKLDMKTQNASVILTSLDGKNLNHAEEILVSTAARVRNARKGKDSNIMSEIVTGQVELTSEVKNLKLWPLLKDGKRGEPVPLVYTADKRYGFVLPDNAETHWFIIDTNRQLENRQGTLH